MLFNQRFEHQMKRRLVAAGEKETCTNLLPRVKLVVLQIDAAFSKDEHNMQLGLEKQSTACTKCMPELESTTSSTRKSQLMKINEKRHRFARKVRW